GVVCTLHEGDDFGKLALVNDAPRAASIVLREDNCHFLRVDKEDFNRILRDVEANTVRLKEHGQDVLVLENSSRNSVHGFSAAHHKYNIMSGTPEKILKHLLEMMRLDSQFTESALDDFVLMHCVFIPNSQLCPVLRDQYPFTLSFLAMNKKGSELEKLDYTLNNKRRVIRLVMKWAAVHGEHLQQEDMVFLEEFLMGVSEDAKVLLALRDQMTELERIIKSRQTYFFSYFLRFLHPVLFKVYCCDHTYTTIRVPVASSVREVLEAVADKLGSAEDLILVGLSSAGGFNLIFCASQMPLAEQEGPSVGSLANFELMSSKDVAYHMTFYDWELFHCVHEKLPSKFKKFYGEFENLMVRL
ncbi:hypothetical protein GOODEAATRI_014293, partial [Goodea atripinnis]